MNAINKIIELFKTFLVEIGELSFFASRFFKETFNHPFEFREFLRQCFYIGNRSLLLVSITGFIIGLVFTLQSRPTLLEFGAVSWMPRMVSISIIREIGPIITALICAGRIGSGIGAELGSMRVTEQIDAMEVSAINPYCYLVVTRILATTLMIPLLVFYADFVGVFGGFIGMNMHTEVNLFRYFSQSFETVQFLDIVPATLKTVFFGFFIGVIGCYKGFNASKGTASVGIAANEAVVAASLSIFIIDMLAVQITDLFF
jgi:phospholipid/cholesterol/gamma-HCH transport system permease protein